MELMIIIGNRALKYLYCYCLRNMTTIHNFVNTWAVLAFRFVSTLPFILTVLRLSQYFYSLLLNHSLTHHSYKFRRIFFFSYGLEIGNVVSLTSSRAVFSTGWFSSEIRKQCIYYIAFLLFFLMGIMMVIINIYIILHNIIGSIEKHFFFSEIHQ